MKKSEIIKKFQEYLELNYISDNTINNYFSLGNKIINDKHIDTLYNLSSDYLKNYAINFKRKYSISYYNQLGSVLIIIYKILNCPQKMKWFKPLKNTRQRKNTLSFDDIIQMVKSTNNLKHKTIMLLLYSTGVRVSELVNIKRDEIDFDNKVIYINNGKGGFSGVVPLTDLVIKYIKAYIKKEKSEYLFKGIRGKYSVTSVRNIVKNAKIGVTPHLFRHSLITEIVKKDGIYAAKEIARHKNTKSTEWYIHFDKDHLQKIYNPLNIAI